MIWSVTSQKVGCTLETSANQRHIRQWDNWNLVQFPGWVKSCLLSPLALWVVRCDRASWAVRVNDPPAAVQTTRTPGPTWSCWTSGSCRCLSATGAKLSPTGVCSSASAFASLSWDPPSWTWGVRPSLPCSRSPGSSSPSSSSCWWAAAWEDASRKRECR